MATGIVYKIVKICDISSKKVAIPDNSENQSFQTLHLFKPNLCITCHDRKNEGPDTKEGVDLTALYLSKANWEIR